MKTLRERETSFGIAMRNRRIHGDRPRRTPSTAADMRQRLGPDHSRSRRADLSGARDGSS